MTKTLHLEVVSYIILTFFILFLGENFSMSIVNIRRVYATYKNKVSIIICPPTVECSLNMNQWKSTDYQWNLTDSNSWKEVTVNQSNSTDYFSENQLIWQWKIFTHW